MPVDFCSNIGYNSSTVNQEIEMTSNTKMISHADLGIAYDKLLRDQLSKEEIADYAEVISESGVYDRSTNSAVFVLSRMHTLLHGQAPDGETQNRADTMFNIPQSMYDFVIAQGDLDQEDLYMHVREAKIELANRPTRIKKEHAIALMAEYYKNHKKSLPTNVREYRSSIIDQIMEGISPQTAFSVVK